MICLFGRLREGLQRLPRREGWRKRVCFVLFCFPNVHSSQGWGRLKPRARNWASHYPMLSRMYQQEAGPQRVTRTLIGTLVGNVGVQKGSLICRATVLTTYKWDFKRKKVQEMDNGLMVRHSKFLFGKPTFHIRASGIQYHLFHLQSSFSLM